MNNTFNLWKNPPGIHKEIPTISVHIPNVKKSNGTVVIFPGGGYVEKCEHEGIEYAKYLNENGICALVCNYRVSPHKFPLELLDARRASTFLMTLTLKTLMKLIMNVAFQMHKYYVIR